MALYSKRIGSKTLMISDHPDNPNLCYKWSKGGGRTTSTIGGPERYVCAGCRRMKDAKQVEKERKLPARILINETWVDDGPTYQHFCQPFEKPSKTAIRKLVQRIRRDVATPTNPENMVKFIYLYIPIYHHISLEIIHTHTCSERRTFIRKIIYFS